MELAGRSVGARGCRGRGPRPVLEMRGRAVESNLGSAGHVPRYLLPIPKIIQVILGITRNTYELIRITRNYVELLRINIEILRITMNHDDCMKIVL